MTNEKTAAADAAVPDEAFREERWLYAGIRKFNEGRHHCWITNEATGEYRYWSAKGGSALYIVGGYHTAQAARTPRPDGHPGEHIVLRGEPKYTGERADEHTRGQLQAEDMAAKAHLALDALARKHAKEDALGQALKPLMRIAKRMRTGADRNALAAHVLRELGRAPHLADEELED